MLRYYKRMPSQEQILETLRNVIDPDLKKDLVTLGMIQDVVIDKSGKVSLRLVLTTPACPFRGTLETEVKNAVRSVPGVTDAHIITDASVPQMKPLFERAPLPGVRNIIAVASGKGGVGKSAVSVNIAASLAESGARVGLLDADIYGPSMPIMLGIDAQIEVDPEREIMPLEKFGMKLMSFGFIAQKDAAVIWRGPLASKALRQFLKQVRWGELDYLIIDMPPGTGDVHLTLFQTIPLSGGVIVTTPQHVALADATRAIEMFRTLHSPVLGVVENMAGEIFGTGGGEELAKKYGVPFFGRVPLDAIIRGASDAGVPLIMHAPAHAATDAFRTVAAHSAQEVSKTALLDEH